METPPLPLRACRAERDDEHIKLLIVFHYVLAGFCVLGILFLFFHFYVMNTFLGNEELWKNSQEQPPPKEFFMVFKWFYAVIGGVLIAGCVLNVLSALFMKRRVNRVFSMVVAGLNCIQVPLGTLLGVFTIVVLMKPTVQSTYQNQSLDKSEQ